MSSAYRDLDLPAAIERSVGRGISTTMLAAPGSTASAVLRNIQKARNIAPIDVYNYIEPGEALIGCGHGGSESLVLFLKVSGIREVVVRKILSEKLSATAWEPSGTGAMTPPHDKARLQALYLQALPHDVARYFPTVYNLRERRIPTPVDYRGRIARDHLHEVIVDQSYVPGVEVSRFIARFQPSAEIVAHLYAEIFRLLREKVHIHRWKPRLKPTLESSYLRKIEQRIELSSRMAPKIFTSSLLMSEDIWIDGRKYLNILPLLEKYRSLVDLHLLLEPPRHCLTVGDTNTENIKIGNIRPLLHAMETRRLDFTYDDLEINFLDPRAIGFESCGAETIDDAIYDTKPLHNSLGHYDVIHGGYFRVNLRFVKHTPHIVISHQPNHPFQKSYSNLERYFGYIMERGWGVSQPAFLCHDPHWLIRFIFLMGTHFAAMIPFHFQRSVDGSLVERLSHQQRPLPLYCEGVKWLNWAYQMLTGRLTEFYGLQLKIGSST